MKKAINSINRYERKWVFKNLDFNQICIFLYKSNFFFTNQYADRYVNSIYFDDVNYSSIRQNLDGVSNKKKYRLRWYDDFKVIKDPIFEVKSKNGFDVKKEHYKLNELNKIELINPINLEKIENFINSNFNFKNKLSPILTTHYKRSYFISSNKLIRATVDTNLRSISLTLNNDINIIRKYNHIILEMKYDVDLDHFVRNNVKDINVRFSKNSKFINAATVVPDSLS